jgi:hypothetical protein
MIPRLRGLNRFHHEHSVYECCCCADRATVTPFANMLTRSQHITAMRDSFALAMPL